MQRKKILCMLMAAVMAVSGLETPMTKTVTAETSGAVASLKQPFQELDSEELREDMGSVRQMRKSYYGCRRISAKGRRKCAPDGIRDTCRHHGNPVLHLFR